MANAINQGLGQIYFASGLFRWYYNDKKFFVSMATKLIWGDVLSICFDPKTTLNQNQLAKLPVILEKPSNSALLAVFYV